MTKRRLPPPTRESRPLVGPKVTSFTVGSWCPTLDGTGPATAVAISIETSLGDLVLRFKSPAMVDDLIQSLLRHKRDVWPDSP
jgi:hypothetical protein